VAAMMVVLAVLVAWLEVDAIRRMHRTALHDAQAAYEPPRDATIDDLLVETSRKIAGLLDLQACWFEPFPFDTLLPRIERGRIVLPTPEPGVAPCADAGIELPVRATGLTLGRFVLVPQQPSVGVAFAPSARERVIALAALAGPLVAHALIDGDASRA
jgi:hypothetical protein